MDLVRRGRLTWVVEDGLEVDVLLNLPEGYDSLISIVCLLSVLGITFFLFFVSLFLPCFLLFFFFVSS